MRDNSVQSASPATGVGRALEVLQRLSQYPRGVTLEEMAKDIRSPKSSTHRALWSLIDAGLAQQEVPGGPYRLSLDFVRLAFEYYEAQELHVIVRPLLEKLTQKYSAASHFARLEGSEIVYLAKVDRSAPGIQMTSIVGGRNPAHCTGLGKALLAHELRDSSAIAAYIDTYGPLQARTKETIVEPDRLDEELAKIRSRGFATEREESEMGVACVAVPLFLASPSQPVGAVSLSLVIAAYPGLVLDDIGEQLLSLVSELRP